MIETLYRVRKRDRIAGTPIALSADELVEVLGEDVPMTVVGTGRREIAALTDLVADLSIHDAMIVASHRTHTTQAIVTNDPEINAIDVPTVWQ